jgi:hypothetical protein
MAQSLIGTGASLMFDMLGKEAAAQAALRPRPFHIERFYLLTFLPAMPLVLSSRAEIV